MQRRAKSEASTDPLASPNSPSSSRKSPRSKAAKHGGSVSTLTLLVLSIPVFSACVLLFAGLYFVPPDPNRLRPNNAAIATVATLPHQPSAITKPTVVASSSNRNVQSSNKVATTGESIGTGSSVEYYIVFSTSCSVFQDWQSYVFFHRALVVGQPGTITRIASGCQEDEEAAARKVFQEQIEPMAPGRFKIHFTPDFSSVKPGVKFTYFNKPFGMKHWLENALGHPANPVNDDAIIVLMDPDQLITRPFANNDFTNERWVHLKKGEEPRTRIEHGAPMGQLYGFGLQWKSKVNMTYISPNEHSPVDDLTHQEAQSGYIVGPPYIATARDMHRIVVKWCEFGPRVHDMYPYLLAEMFAYCLGAAHVKLPHQIAASFMVSDVGMGEKSEGWGYIDDMPNDKICGPHSPAELPHVIHFCQRYGLSDYFFGKRRLPGNFLSCESPLLAEPPMDIASKYKYANWPDGKRKEFSGKMAKRNAYMLCKLLPAINEAATYYKERHCDTVKANFNKTLMFINIPY